MSYGMPPSSDFAGKDVPDFAVGSMTAARFWSMDKYGRLVGHYGQVWRPGENVARCPSSCAGIEADCTCGFYGYHDIDHVIGYSSDEYLVGVIEAYGVVVVGGKGLRCSKAKVIGLHATTSFQRAAVARYYPETPLVSVKRLRKLLRYNDWLPEPDADFWTRDTQPLRAPEHYAKGGTLGTGVTFYWTQGGNVAVTNSGQVIGYSGSTAWPSMSKPSHTTSNYAFDPPSASTFKTSWSAWNGHAESTICHCPDQSHQDSR